MAIPMPRATKHTSLQDAGGLTCTTTTFYAQAPASTFLINMVLCETVCLVMEIFRQNSLVDLYGATGLKACSSTAEQHDYPPKRLLDSPRVEIILLLPHLLTFMGFPSTYCIDGH